MRDIFIQKADGKMELFDENKLRNSLLRSGASKKLAERVVKHIVSGLKDGMSTGEIYANAFDVLRKFEHEHPIAAARYSIKRALLELGPSGFPFEQFIAGVMRAHGAEFVDTGVMMQGKCVMHEVDVAGVANGKRFVMEVKFHNSLSTKTDLKVALYVKARWDDLMNTKRKDHIDQGWLVTNTRFTDNVVRYAKCVGNLKLLGWDYPKGRGLEVLIEEAKLQPVTMLTTLTAREKRYLLERDYVLCRHLCGRPDILREAGVKESKIDFVLEQINALCEELY